MKWIKWKDQNELAHKIRYCIDTGSHRDLIIEQIMHEHPDKYTKDEINKEISELKKKWLIVKNDGMLFVSEWSHDAIIKATGQKSFQCALRRLKQFGVYHPDMLRDKIITEDEVPK